MKKFNLAALPLAVVGILASNTASAGVEACFESYRVAAGAPGVVTNHSELYTPATCGFAPRGAAAATSLAAIDNAKIAWELTGDLDIDLESLGAVNPRHHIVYIPTTDVPPASRITMELTGADFGVNNANQLYLVRLNKGLDGNVGGGDDQYQTVASSDGAFNSTKQVTFLTKAGVTIGAGSRLLISQKNPEDVNEDGTLIEGIALHLANQESCTIEGVTIAAIKAETDGGSPILGATSEVATTGANAGQLLRTDVVDVMEQFQLISGADATSEIEVDAEQPSFRTQFVNNGGTNWTNKVIAEEAFWESKFVNNFGLLDANITVHANDRVTLALKSDSSTGAGVSLSLITDKVDATDTSILDNTQATHRAAGATISLVDIENSTTDMLALTTTSVDHPISADELFPTNLTNVSNTALVLANDNTPNPQVMEFNYEVDVNWSMTFNNTNYLGKSSTCKMTTPYEVGVNGAVLKVPYTFDTNNNWVRITSEHDNEATVFMDIFDESSKEWKNVNLGKIQGKSSEVYYAADMIAQAKQEGYTSTGDLRHTMTFTVTAPKNKVHGVSIQKVPGGADRVMPVLDLNDWRQ